jgi:hypothetical protein
MLAKWAAGRLGYKGENMDRYVRNMIFSYLTMPSDRKMIDKILSDFEAANISISENELREKIKSIEIRIKNKSEMDEHVD